MPKQVKQLSPLLTLFETRQGCYSLRLSEVSKRATFLSIEVAKLLTDATSLEVITPTDMKVFDFTGEKPKWPVIPVSEAAKDEEELYRREQPESEVLGPMPPDSPSMDQVIEIAEANEEAQKTNGEERRFRPRKPRVEPIAGYDEPCQRCQGSGTVQMLMEGGRPATSTCPVCQGERVVRRFGARPQ